ncbi:MAG: anthranilate synthase component I family protein [Candidatus Omnitrophica bacterium]|nr:anthranilate synthase component I family protein [Candidatus Omnitrophota bacterium]
MFLLSVSELEEKYRQGFTVPLLFRFKSALKPQSVYSALAHDGPSVLLESPTALPGDDSHRYSYIAWNPYLSVRIHENRCDISYRDGKKSQREGTALGILKSILSEWKGSRWPGIDFFTGGAVAALGYELACQFEKLPEPSRLGDEVPDIIASIYDRVVIIDKRNDEITISRNLCPSSGIHFEKAYETAMHEIESLAHTINSAPPDGYLKAVSVEALKASITEGEFHRMVRSAQEYIRSGDIYQANLSQRFEFTFQGSAFGLYQRLHKINPSPYAAYVDWVDIQIVSASPERLIRLRGDLCETRPIAGTRPRGRSEIEREQFREDLLLSEKERAEHLMLVDLERNDLGHLSVYGTVCVDEWMTVECYSHVQHIVSNVRGRLKPDFDRFDLIRAMFPGGTITGCPKIRCMEIIHELERERRGFYTGSLGYLDFNGDMDLNILIRTIFINGSKGSFRVGSGIVADSREVSEYQETLHKAAAIFDALSHAGLAVPSAAKADRIPGAKSLKKESQFV